MSIILETVCTKDCLEWTLLTTPADYEIWHAEQLAHYAVPPPAYPAFAIDSITADEEKTYHYMTVDDAFVMAWHFLHAQRIAAGEVPGPDGRLEGETWRSSQSSE